MTQKELIINAQKGDQDAMTKLVTQNEKLIFDIVNKYCFNQSQKSDLEQEGRIALLTAIHKYKIDSKAKLSSFAYDFIKGAVLKSLNLDRIIKLPDSVVNKYIEIKKAITLFENRHAKSPTNEEISECLNYKYDAEEIFNILNTIKETQIIDDEDGTILNNLSINNDVEVESSSSLSFEQYYYLLKDIEITVLEHRKNGVWPKQIGKLINKTENQVRKIEHSAISKIRKAIKNTKK